MEDERLLHGGMSIGHYRLNYYAEVREKDRIYYEDYTLPRIEEAPEGYKENSFVCLRPDDPNNQVEIVWKMKDFCMGV